jgi:hypothetical protein
MSKIPSLAGMECWRRGVMYHKADKSIFIFFFSFFSEKIHPLLSPRRRLYEPETNWGEARPPRLSLRWRAGPYVLKWLILRLLIRRRHNESIGDFYPSELKC